MEETYILASEIESNRDPMQCPKCNDWMSDFDWQTHTCKGDDPVESSVAAGVMSCGVSVKNIIFMREMNVRPMNNPIKVALKVYLIVFWLVSIIHLGKYIELMNNHE